MICPMPRENYTRVYEYSFLQTCYSHKLVQISSSDKIFIWRFLGVIHMQDLSFLSTLKYVIQHIQVHEAMVQLLVACIAV